MDNVTLIGMPGSGKTTLGRALAEKLSMRFVDVDREIERLYGGTLAQLIERNGQAGFRALEEKTNADLDLHDTVIAPGGSVIYGERAMRHLRAISTVVYLGLSYSTVRLRLGDLTARGVSFAPGQTLLSLYNERCPLYERWAHLTLNCDGMTRGQSTRRLIELLQAQSLPSE